MYFNKSRVFKVFIVIFICVFFWMVYFEFGFDWLIEIFFGCLWWFILGGELLFMIFDSGKIFRGLSLKVFFF